MTEPFPRKEPAFPNADPYLNEDVFQATRCVEDARAHLRLQEERLRAARGARGQIYACRCCGQRSTTPLGMFDHNQCGICWNGIHGLPGCKHPKGHLDHD